jgi:uncharacterized membrane protein YfcA
VHWSEALLTLTAGIGAGTINTIVGSGTLITFPVLVAFGYPPVVATMSNSVGLVPGGVSGTWGYRRELEGQWRRLRWQVPGSLLGAITGAFLLLHLPEDAFVTVVPVLLVLALLLVILQARIQAWARHRTDAAGRDHTELTVGRLGLLVAGTYLAGVYGGYFAAAQGILLVGIMGALLPEAIQRVNAAKNLLTLVVNVVAAAGYALVAFDRINWAAAGLIAAGSLSGGFLGATIGRRVPPAALKVIIVALGIVAIWRILAL